MLALLLFDDFGSSVGVRRQCNVIKLLISFLDSEACALSPLLPILFLLIFYELLFELLDSVLVFEILVILILLRHSLASTLPNVRIDVGCRSSTPVEAHFGVTH